MGWFSFSSDEPSKELELREAARRDPLNPAPRNRLGDWLASQERLVDAIREYRRAGKAYLSREQYRRAQVVLRKAFQLDPGNQALADLLVHACRLANRPQSAAEVFYAQARHAKARGDEAAAYLAYGRGVAENPADLRRRVRLVKWSQNLGKVDRAADLLLELAEYCAKTRHRDQARGFLEQARELRNGPKAALTLAKILMHEGQRKEAREVAEQAAERFPGFPGLQDWLTEHGKPKAAKTPSPVQIDPALRQKLRNQLARAKDWGRRGYPDKALGLIQRMLLLDPGFGPALDLAQKLHQESGRLSHFQRLCISCSQRLGALGRHQEAFEVLDRVEVHFPGSTVAYRMALRAEEATP